MPTGYTAAIAEGITFEKFALNCARAFGALISMRDEPSNAEIPERLPETDYHSVELMVAKEGLKNLKKKSGVEKEVLTRLHNKEEASAYDLRKKEKDELEVKYKEMLARVVQWVPPTSEHQGLKDFMASQIRDSIDHDCSMKYDTKPKPLSTEEWYQQELEKINWSIDYHTREGRKESERNNDKNQWLSDLRQSLSGNQ